MTTIVWKAMKINSLQMERAKKALGIGNGLRKKEVAAKAKKAMMFDVPGSDEQVLIRFLSWIEFHTEVTAQYRLRLGIVQPRV